MVIIKPKKKQFSFEEYIERTTPPEDALWSHGYRDYTYEYDLQEQIYKKKKLYFHISPEILIAITARTKQGRRAIPVAFYAQDPQTCIDYFRFAVQGAELRKGYLYRSVNTCGMNLFNPAVKFDLDSLMITDAMKKQFVHILNPSQSGGKNIRYWRILESNQILQMIYTRPNFDGLALDFYKAGTTDWEKRTAGFGLFDRADGVMRIIDVAAIDNIYDHNLDGTKLNYVPLPEFINSRMKNSY